MSVVQRLRQNDPAETRIHIDLRIEPSDADLAEALEQNPFVAEIEFNLYSEYSEQRADYWNSLRRVIATRANLETVKLRSARRNNPAGLVRAFLQAIQQNTAIQRVMLLWLRLPTDISAFLNSASSITSFGLHGCEMEPAAEREQGASDLVAALQRNANIKSLELGMLEDIYTIPILEGLRLNTAVKTFTFSSFVPFSDAASRAVQHLLDSTALIQRFELRNEPTISESLFRPIAQGIIKSECVSELKFSSCRFEDQSSIAPLQSILLNKRNLTSLCLDACHFGGGQVHEDIISMLLRPGSLLRCFEFQSLGSLEGVPFESLLRATEKSKLEQFKIGSIQSQQQLQTLTGSIPLMRIKELEVTFAGQILRENANARQNLLLAIKKNFSLRSAKGGICINSSSSDLFESAEDKHRLAFYANRNESLDQWVNHPETIKQKVWPEALSLAERAGPNALFRGLRSVLGRDYVSAGLPGGRKRKRPQYYAPW